MQINNNTITSAATKQHLLPRPPPSLQRLLLLLLLLLLQSQQKNCVTSRKNHNIPRASVGGTCVGDEGRKRRLGFGKKGKSSFTVHRSEEVLPEDTASGRSGRQPSSASSDGEGSGDGDRSEHTLQNISSPTPAPLLIISLPFDFNLPFATSLFFSLFFFLSFRYAAGARRRVCVVDSIPTPSLSISTRFRFKVTTRD